jgi:dihydropyrimidinase
MRYAMQQVCALQKCQGGTGRFLARSGGEAARPAGRLVADMSPEQNFGATLL